LPNGQSLRKCPLSVSGVTYRNYFTQFVNNLAKEDASIFQWLVFIVPLMFKYLRIWGPFAPRVLICSPLRAVLFSTADL